jgi:hypothetical protein
VKFEYFRASHLQVGCGLFYFILIQYEKGLALRLLIQYEKGLALSKTVLGELDKQFLVN